MGNRIKQGTGIYQQYDRKIAPPSITDTSQTQGLGTPQSPVGAKVAGATPDQAKMVGTPAQQQYAQRQAEPTQPSLQQVQREKLDGAAPTAAQQQAKEKAESLSRLGPARASIESLIQQRIQQTTQQQAQLGVNEQAIQAISDPAKRQQAEAALTAYLADPTEQNLQTVYDVLGEAALEQGGLSRFLQGAPEAVAAAAQPQLQGIPTIGQLDLVGLGITPVELADALGVSEAELQGMTLDDLDTAIDAIEAAELNTVSAIQAELSDPTLTPARRQQLLAQLQSMGAAGVTGAEQTIDTLEEQIQQAGQIQIMGQTYSLEQALGDQGISALIAQAVQDPDTLQRLKEDRQLRQLGNWIEQNQGALAQLTTDLQTDVSDFLTVQQDYKQLKTSLGEGGADILGTLLGRELPESALSADVQQIQQELQSDPVYNYLQQNSDILAEAKTDPELLQKMMQSGYTTDQLREAFDLRQDLREDSNLQALTGLQPGFITDPDQLQAAQEIASRYNTIDADITMDPTVAQLTQAGDLDIDDLEDIASSPNSQEIISDLQLQRSMQRDVQQIQQSPRPAEAVQEYVFNDTGVSENDLRYAMQNMDPGLQSEIMSIFNLDGDDKISQSELNDPNVATRLGQQLTPNLDQIIAAGGKYDPQGMLSRIAGQVHSNSLESAVHTMVTDYVSSQTKQIGAEAQQNLSRVADIERSLAGNPFGQITGQQDYEKAREQLDLPEQYRKLIPSSLDAISKRHASIGAPTPASEIDNAIGTLEQLLESRSPMHTREDKAEWQKYLGQLRNAKQLVTAGSLVNSKQRLERDIQQLDNKSAALRDIYDNIVSTQDEERMLQLAKNLGIDPWQ